MMIAWEMDILYNEWINWQFLNKHFRLPKRILLWWSIWRVMFFGSRTVFCGFIVMNTFINKNCSLMWACRRRCGICSKDIFDIWWRISGIVISICVWLIGRYLGHHISVNERLHKDVKYIFLVLTTYVIELHVIWED